MFVQRLDKPGRDVCVLHGWGRDHTAMEPFGQLLDGNIHLVDLPGFGKSPRPDGVWSTFDYADHLAHYLDQNHIAQCNLVGHSFGGKIALCFAARYPERVGKLVLAAASGLRGKKTWKGRGVALLGRLSKKMGIFESWFVPRFGSRDYQLAGEMRPILVKTVNDDLTEIAKHLKVKTLLLWGGRDTETPLWMGQRYTALIPNAELICFKRKGHDLFEGGGADLMAKYVKIFLNKE